MIGLIFFSLYAEDLVYFVQLAYVRHSLHHVYFYQLSYRPHAVQLVYFNTIIFSFFLLINITFVRQFMYTLVIIIAVYILDDYIYYV